MYIIIITLFRYFGSLYGTNYMPFMF